MLTRCSLGPCYHMAEVIHNGQKDMQMWIDAFEGKEVDWDDLFARFVARRHHHYLFCCRCYNPNVHRRYSSGVDNPVSQFYDVLAKKYPDAKVILSVRW